MSKRFRISAILPTSSFDAIASDKRPKIDRQNIRAFDESIGSSVVDGIVEATGGDSTGLETMESLGISGAAGGGSKEVGGGISGAVGAG